MQILWLQILEIIGLFSLAGLDSIAVSLFGNMTVEPGEMHKITKVSEQKIPIIILILKRGHCLALVVSDHIFVVIFKTLRLIYRSESRQMDMQWQGLKERALPL